MLFAEFLIFPALYKLAEEMVGGSIRRDEGSFTISNTNVFSALESLRKKKKSDKVKKSKSSSKAPSKEPEPQVFWAPTPLNAKSWADVDDEDDDDYYATTAPPQAAWKIQESEQSKASSAAVEVGHSAFCLLLNCQLILLIEILT